MHMGNGHPTFNDRNPCNGKMIELMSLIPYKNE